MIKSFVNSIHEYIHQFLGFEKNETRLSNNVVYDYHINSQLYDIKIKLSQYIKSLRVESNGEFKGYRYSHNTKQPVLYATIAVLLVKHLYNIQDNISEELEYLHQFQSNDGLFKDPVVNCDLAETEDWWGWRHLTLHVLMTMALYNIPARKEIRYIDQFKNENYFKDYLLSRDWGERAAWTSNELQNLGVMLQYSRDNNNDVKAGFLMEMMYDVLDAKQDRTTGLFGNTFESPMELSLGVQSGYHFWLLYEYDNRPINHIEKIIDNVLKTQNLLGGYGVTWNSSACEDIDSIDPLVRLSKKTDYRKDDIQASLRRALPWILYNLNGDGGFVFKRHEALTVVHVEMFSDVNQSNLFYSWFRSLGLAYCLSGLSEVPEQLKGLWNFKHAPGHQFL